MKYYGIEADCKRMAQRVAKESGKWKPFIIAKIEIIHYTTENGNPVYVEFNYNGITYIAYEYIDSRGIAWRQFKKADEQHFKDNMEG